MLTITTELELWTLVAEKVMGECLHTFVDLNNPDGGGVLPGHRCNCVCSKCDTKPDGYNHNSKWMTRATDADKMLELIRFLHDEHNLALKTTLYFDALGWVRVNMNIDYDSHLLGTSAGEIEADGNPLIAVCLAALRGVGLDVEWRPAE